MKKILMVLDNGFKPDLRVQKEINTLIKLGYSVDIYCWDQEGGLPKTESKDNFNIFRLELVVEKQQGVKKVFDLVRFYKLVYLEIKKNRINYNYIYVHDFLLLPLGVLLKLLFRLPLIYDAHEIYHLMEWEKYNSTIRKVIFSVEKFFSKFANAFVVVNQNRKDFYNEFIKNKISVIGNWYDPYDGEFVDLKKMYKIPDNEIVVSYFGVINFNERPINEFIDTLMKEPNIHFFVAGVGKDEDAIVEYEKKYERLHYLGWQKNIRKFLNKVDYIIYYMNSERKYFQYTAPNTLYLAISHGIPIITNVPGESEVLIRNNNIGYFIKDSQNITNEIDFDLSSDEYAQKLSSVKKIKDKYKWSACEQTYTDIFSSIS